MFIVGLGGTETSSNTLVDNRRKCDRSNVGDYLRNRDPNILEGPLGGNLVMMSKVTF